MKIVSYGRGNFYFLTNDQFEAAKEEWVKGNSISIKDLEILLPPPKNPAGVPHEHRGLQICYSWNLPGWVAVQRPIKNEQGVEIKRAAVYARDLDRCYEKGERYYWREINVL